MWTHTDTLGFGAFFLLASVLSFIGAANRKMPWYTRYIAFAIGATFFVLGILIPIRLWNM
ncbi:MAG: hypothetical protein WBW69_22100 [Candidatus Korobacteraceae bacterium]